MIAEQDMHMVTCQFCHRQMGECIGRGRVNNARGVKAVDVVPDPEPSDTHPNVRREVSRPSDAD